MPYQIRKLFKFEGAHILSSAFSKECSNHIHGHSYIVEVYIRSNELNEDGMVIDFKLLSNMVSEIIDAWDHQLLISCDDSRDILCSQSEVRVPFNPTAENMAKFLFNQISNRIALTIPDESKNNPSVYKIRIHETSTGFAEYWEDSMIPKKYNRPPDPPKCKHGKVVGYQTCEECNSGRMVS